MFDDGMGFNGDSYFVKRAARQIIEDKEFIDKMLENEIDLHKSADEILVNKYERWGRAASFVVDLVLREIPPHPRRLGRAALKLGRGDGFVWPEGMFAMAAEIGTPEKNNEEPEPQTELFELDEEMIRRQAGFDEDEMAKRIEAAAKLFADAKNVKLKEAALPLLGKKIRYKGTYKINPGYATLMRRITPPHLRKRELKDAYVSGFDDGVNELGLDDLSLKNGKEILRRAPRRIRVMPVGETPDKVHVLSEHGSRLTLQQQPEDGANLPLTPESVWARTRAQEAIPPDATELCGTFERVLADLKGKVDKDANF